MSYNWLPENNLLGLLLSVAALTLAVVNYFRTSTLANQQFQLAFSKPLSDWALSLVQIVDDLWLIDNDLPPEDKKHGFLDILLRLKRSRYHLQLILPTMIISKEKLVGSPPMKHSRRGLDLFNAVVDLMNQVHKLIESSDNHDSSGPIRKNTQSLIERIIDMTQMLIEDRQFTRFNAKRLVE